MSFFSPSKLSATAKIALFESSPRSRRRKLSGSAPLLQADPSSLNARSALSFLSPNLGRTKHGNKQQQQVPTPPTAPVSTPSPQRGAVSDLKKQVEDIQGRILVLDAASPTEARAQNVGSSNTDNNDKTSSHRPLTAKKKADGSSTRNTTAGDDDDIHQLQVRLRNIQEGLSLIEEERQSLADRAQRLEQEKQELQVELEHREREISCLSRRCASQADRIKEVSKLRSTNQELAIMVQQLKMTLANAPSYSRMGGLSELEGVVDELERCQRERDGLVRRLAKIQNDHEEVSRNLGACLETMEKLLREKQEWEEERNRVTSSAGRVREYADNLEQQRRLQQINSSNTEQRLKDQLRSRDGRIQLMEKALREKGSANSDLKEALRTTDEKMRLLEQSLHDKHKDPDKLQRQMSDMEQQHRFVLGRLERNRRSTDEKARVLEQSLHDKSDILQLQMSEMEQKHRLECDRSERNRRAIDEKARILEQSLHGKSEDHDELQRQMSEMKQRHRSELDRSDRDRRHEIELSNARMKDEYEQELGQLHSELDDKSWMVSLLKEEVAETMGRLMVSTQKLDKAEQDSAICQSLMEDVSTLEQERSSLLEALHEKDTEIAELSAEILKLEIEKEFITHDSNGNAESLERSYRDLKKANKMILKLKQQERLPNDQVIASLRDQLFKSEEKARLLEVQLRKRDEAETPQKVEAAPDGDEQSMNGLRSDRRDLRMLELPDLEETATSATTEVMQLRMKLKSKELELSHSAKNYESRLRELESKLEDRDLRGTERSLESQDLVNELTQTIIDLKNAAEQNRTSIRMQERQLKEVVADNAILSQKLCTLNGTDIVVSRTKDLESKVEEREFGAAQLQRRFEGLQLQQFADRERVIERSRGDFSGSSSDLEVNENVGRKANVVTPPVNKFSGLTGI